MNILLIFFAIPIAIIILSAIFETFIKCPVKVAGIFFSIFLVIAFALGGSAELLVAVIVYTIISFVTAYIVMMIRCRRENECCRNNNCDTCKPCHRCNNCNVFDDWNKCNYNNYDLLSNTLEANNNTTLESENNFTNTNFNNMNNCCKRYR